MNLTEQDITQAVKSSVNAYLMTRVYAETMRETVDPFYREALKIFPIYTDLVTKRSGSREGKLERIFNHNDMYLSEDKETCKTIYADVNHQLRKKGIKPDSMPDDYCPALTAEHLQIKAEHLLIDAAAEMLGKNGDFRSRVLSLGLDKYQEFINLVVRLVVNLPDFKTPLTGKEV